MNAYLIRYRKSDYDDDYLIERPSLWRLLLWLVLHAHNCRMIHILRFYKVPEPPQTHYICDEEETNERH